MGERKSKCQKWCVITILDNMAGRAAKKEKEPGNLNLSSNVSLDMLVLKLLKILVLNIFLSRIWFFYHIIYFSAFYNVRPDVLFAS